MRLFAHEFLFNIWLYLFVSRKHVGNMVSYPDMAYKDANKQREFQRLRNARNRHEFMKDKKCRCGSIDKLELHHKNPEEKVSHKIWSWSKERREKEAQKCEVLCHKCHREETRRYFGWYLKHGTTTGYNGYGCRCRACKEANKLSMRRYRKQRRILDSNQ